MSNKDNDDDEPSVWVTVLKLVVGAIIIIGATGMALWYVSKTQEQHVYRDPASAGSNDWGIANDSPIHRLH